MPTRSGTLFFGTLAGEGANLLFSVPLATTVIVKHLVGANFSASAVNLGLYIGNGPADLNLAGSIPVGASSGLVQELWVALGPGLSFGLGSSGTGGFRVLVSGAVLPGAIAPLPAARPSEVDVASSE